MADKEKNPVDLNQLNDRHESESFTNENFTDKEIKKIKFNSIEFIKCDFTNAKISICTFDQNCLFSGCKFNGTKFKGCSFNNTKIRECTFVNTEFMDVTIGDDCELLNNSFDNTCIVRNFKVRGQKLDDVTKLTSVVEQINEDTTIPSSSTEVDNATNNPSTEVGVDIPSGTFDNVQTEEEINEEDYDGEEAMKLYNVLFPQILKQYPAFTKDVDENGNEVWTVVIDNIEVCVCADEEDQVWRIMFSILRKDAEFGGDYLGGGELTCGLPNKEITLDALKEVFENVAKSSAKKVAEQTNSQVVKNALNKFVQVVFNVITQSLFGNKGGVVINYSTNPEDVTGVLNSGYDFKTKTPVIIIGKPFVTDNSAESNRVRTLIANGLKFIFGQDDIRNMGLEELTAYAKEHPYSCFVYESNSYYNGRASVRDFGPNDVVILK